MNGYVIGTATSVVGQPAIATGTLRVPVQCQNTEFTLDIKSSSHLPCISQVQRLKVIITIEQEGFNERKLR